MTSMPEALSSIPNNSNSHKVVHTWHSSFREVETIRIRSSRLSLGYLASSRPAPSPKAGLRICMKFCVSGDRLP